MSGYIGTQPIPQSTQTRETFTATASQTSFATGGYQAGYIDVFLNGVKLVDGTDFTATNGSDVVLTTGAASGDTLEVVAYTAFTVADQTFTGDIVMSDGLTVDNDGATVLTVDRATSDGTIIDVQKDGSSVGRIGTNSGTRIYIGSGDANLTFNPVGNYVFPSTSTGGGRDAQLDLGLSAARFKDLYLSGGVYLGGTGSANKLDDYETGTWTAHWGNGATSISNTARYIKIGTQVTFWVDFYNQNISGISGHLRLYGLPFAQSASGPAQGSLAISSNNYDFCFAELGSNTSNIYLYRDGNGAADFSQLRNTDWTNSGSQATLRGQFSYRTDS